MANRQFSGIFVAVLCGFIVTVLLGFFSGVISFFSGVLGMIFLFDLLFIPLGLIVGSSFPENGWKLGLFLSLPYSILLVYFLSVTIYRNLNFYGVFGQNEFFISGLLMYLFPIIVACASTYAGADLGFKKISIIVFVFISSIATAVYILSHHPIVDTKTFAVNLIENENLLLEAETKCVRWRHKDPMNFRNYDRGDCLDSKLHILKKTLNFDPTTTFYWTFDGVKEPQSIIPKGKFDDSFNSAYIDSQDPELTDTWAFPVPATRIVNSKQVNFTWGKLNIEFGETEFKNFRELLALQREFIYNSD